jgi:hypothetical protein
MLRGALLFLWELPQNILGLLVLGLERGAGTVKEIRIEHDRMVIQSTRNAVSLGYFVFWSEGVNRYFILDDLTREHEIGHSFQSRLLGPLYLPLVGVPSVLHVLYAMAYREVTGRRWTGYFDTYPESWADRLGGVAERRAERKAKQQAK